MEIRDLIDIIENVQVEPEVGDVIELELGDTLIETTISEVLDDGVVIHIDESALRLMVDAKKQQLNEGATKHAMHADAEKMNLEQFVDKYAPRPEDRESVKEFWKNVNDEDGDEAPTDDEKVKEAKYQGREVPLGKKMKGDVKKSKVYVRKPNGNVVKVEFGDPNMRIKKSNPKRRKSFRARHNCDNPGPRWKARYWSCRAW
jgi:hypothetical protein